MTRQPWSFRMIHHAGLMAVALAVPPVPAVGTVEWARAVNRAWAEVQQADPEQVIERSEKLLALYGKCTGCRLQVYEARDRMLSRRLADKPLLQQAQEAEFAHDPVSLSRLYLESGRAKAARDLAARELRHTRFLERRLDLMEVLAGAEHELWHLKASRKLARRLLEEAPVSPRYCDKALHWMTWLGEDPVTDPTSIGPRDFLARFEAIREMEQRRGNDAYVSCVMAHAFARWDRFVSGMEQVNGRVDPDVLALFPEGIDGPLEDLARRTTDPTVRAAVLLQAMERWWTRSDRPHLNALIEEALQAGQAPNIQSGALVWKAGTIAFDLKQEREAFALDLIDRFPDSEAAISGCHQYWTILGYQRPDFPSRIPDWKNKCLGLFQRNPDRVRRWQFLMMSMTPEPECAVEVYHALQAMQLPDELTPMILLRLSAALRKQDPMQAWELERQAIHHPQFPGLGEYLYWSFFNLEETLSRAKEQGDDETAEFLHELNNRPVTRIIAMRCVPLSPDDVMN